MEIKFTHTGAIPYDEFPEYQEFLILRECERSPLFICKEDDGFRIVDGGGYIGRLEEFIAWEPTSITLPALALATKRLWLTSANLLSPRGWVFSFYENLRTRVKVWIRDPQFNRDFFTEQKLSVSPGDVFEATMARSSRGCGMHEVYKICRIGNENEKLRKLLDEL